MEMNIVFGCLLFISYVVLEILIYLRDDMIFIKVVVDNMVDKELVEK